MADERFNGIRVVMAESEKSNKWLAEKLGKTGNTVSRWINNKSQPSIEQLYDIAKTLDVDVRELLEPSK